MGSQAELGYLFMRQSTVASGEFPASLAYVEVGSIISSRPCIWQSCFLCLGVARGVEVLDFSGDAAFM